MRRTSRWGWGPRDAPNQPALQSHLPVKRTLAKLGHTGALEALGYGPAKVALSRFDALTEKVTLGGTLEFEAEITSVAETDQPLIIDYVIHHMRANGKTTPKVFKWKTATLKAGAVLKGSRRHPMRSIATRRCYSGHHKVELLVNGENFGGANFLLLTE